jgi:hypothetical protein
MSTPDENWFCREFGAAATPEPGPLVLLCSSRDGARFSVGSQHLMHCAERAG